MTEESSCIWCVSHCFDANELRSYSAKEASFRGMEVHHCVWVAKSAEYLDQRKKGLGVGDEAYFANGMGPDYELCGGRETSFCDFRIDFAAADGMDHDMVVLGQRHHQLGHKANDTTTKRLNYVYYLHPKWCKDRRLLLG